MSWEVLSGDCVEQMAAMESASIDAVVCDPPYGLEFMGKEWDRLSDQPGYTERGRITERESEASGFIGAGGRGVNSYQAGKPMQEWHEAWAREALRVLKPGGHLLAFGGSRTYHRLAAGIEDAGFEIRDCICWLYGSGFPKSMDISLAIDKAAGAEREVVGPNPYNHLRGETTEGVWVKGEQTGFGGSSDVTAPATDLAKEWEGWGTALKPAFEPVVVARKPLKGTVVANVTEFGTGGLNIDGCRIPASDKAKFPVGDYGERGLYGADGDRTDDVAPDGRFPANVIMDLEAGEVLDAQAGEGKSGTAVKRNLPVDGARQSIDLKAPTLRGDDVGYGDAGGPSRFFYCAKSSTAERNAGLNDFEAQRRATGYGAIKVRECLECGSRAKPSGKSDLPWPTCGHENWEWREQKEGAAKGETRNPHPTVKPIDLMRWCVRLVTPPNGVILDPFTGSGTTGVAAGLEGVDFIGIEREPEYVEIAKARIEWWSGQSGETADVLKRAGLSEKERSRHEAMGQLGLLDG